MADRFPSIEDIDAGKATEAVLDDSSSQWLTASTDQTDGNADNSTRGGDFLSRERAALGQDADQFATAQDVPSVSVQDGDMDDDLLGGGAVNGTNNEMSQFQSNFPAIDSRNERVAPGGTITGSTSPFLSGARSSTLPTRGFSPAPSEHMEDSEVIKSWRAERDAQIEKREQAAAARKETSTREAQESIDEFYKNYNQKTEKSVAQTRKEAEEFLAKREDTSSGGTSWERIAKLVEVRGKGGAAPGKERFKSLLADLSKDSEAPGAKGY